MIPHAPGRHLAHSPFLRAAPLVPALALLALLALSGCGSDDDELEGTGRLIEGDQCFLVDMSLETADPPQMRRDVLLCEPDTIDPWVCPDELDNLDVETAATLDVCGAVVFGEVAFVDPTRGQETIRLALLTLDDDGRQVLVDVPEIDIRAIGENPDGVLATPVNFGPCEFSAGVNLDANCEDYTCAWSELSTNPCGGVEPTGSTEVPVTCFEDEQPDNCDPTALTFGAGDFITIEEMTLVETDGRLSVLEQTVVSGTFQVTVRAAYPDDTFSEMTLTGTFRSRVGSNPFATVSDLVCTSCL